MKKGVVFIVGILLLVNVVSAAHQGEGVNYRFSYLKTYECSESDEGHDIYYKGRVSYYVGEEEKKFDDRCKDATYLLNGKKIALILDTLPCANCIKAAKDADLLISEATFSDQHKEKARKFGHLTASESAKIAKKARANKLILTHFSQRYKNVKELEVEAKKIFKNSIAAHDFLEIKM